MQWWCVIDYDLGGRHGQQGVKILFQVLAKVQEFWKGVGSAEVRKWKGKKGEGSVCRRDGQQGVKILFEVLAKVQEF